MGHPADGGSETHRYPRIHRIGDGPNNPQRTDGWCAKGPGITTSREIQRIAWSAQLASSLQLISVLGISQLLNLLLPLLTMARYRAAPDSRTVGQRASAEMRCLHE